MKSPDDINPSPAGNVSGLIAAARMQAERLRDLPDRAARLAGVRARLGASDSSLSATLWRPEDVPEELAEHYTVTGELKRGGQGIIYVAVQKSTGRRVAIKVMRQGPFAAHEDRIRFEREVQILAQLDHPNIVGILDSGVSRGLFYFVMDYVEGQSLAAWMTERGEWLTTRKRGTINPLPPGETPPPTPPYQGGRQEFQGRQETLTPFSLRGRGVTARHEMKRRMSAALTLFHKICQAVNAAHLRGVIHRDLKPGNIQIDHAGEPHVLDFGLAKMEEFEGQASSAAVNMTQTGRFFGSIPWSSPEQAAGRLNDVDIRSDVYSLGVILFQLLTGDFPYPIEGDLTDVLNNVRHAEPTRPRSLNRAIDDELETIVLTALKKDPLRRYQSAGALADDIQRYTSGEPIAARRDSLSYLIRKQLSRHWVAIAVVAAFLVVLAAGGATSAVLWRRAAAQRDLAIEARATADTRRKEAEQLVNLFQSLLTSANPLEVKGPDYSVASLLDDFNAGLGDSLDEQPQVEASLRRTMGRAYRQLSQFDKAEENLQAALDIFRSLYGDASDQTAASMMAMAYLRKDQGRFAEAEQLFRDALATMQQLHGEGDDRSIEALKGLGETLGSASKFLEAEPVARRAVELARGLNKPEQLASCLHNLGSLLDDLNKDGAVAAYQESIGIYREVYGERHPDIAVGLVDLANLQTRQGAFVDAEANVRQGIEILAACYGADNVKVVGAEEVLSSILQKVGRLDDAEALTRRALDIKRRVLGEFHPRVAGSLNNLGLILNNKGMPAEARTVYLESIDVRRRSQAEDSHEIAVVYNNLARSEFMLGELAAAEEHLQAALTIDQRLFSADHPAVLDDLRGMAHVYEAKGDFAQAVVSQRQVVDALVASQGPDAPAVGPPRKWLGDLLARHGNALLTQADTSAVESNGSAAEPDANAAEPDTSAIESAATAAEPVLRECLEIRRELLPDTDWRIGSSCSLLGDVLRRLDRTDEAEPLLHEGWTRVHAAADAPAQTKRDVAERWAAFLEQAGRVDEATQVRATMPPQ